MSGRGNRAGAALPKSRPPARRAAKAAKEEIPNAVKREEEYARQARKQKQAAKIKKKNRDPSKGRGTAEKNNRGKGGRSGVGAVPDWAFPGDGRRLDSKNSAGAGAGAMKLGETRLIGGSIHSKDAGPVVDNFILSTLVNTKNKTLLDSLKNDVVRLGEANKNNQKLASLVVGDVTFEEARGGTKYEGGVVLGVKEDYERIAPSDMIGVDMDWKNCTATYKGGQEMFRMYPAGVVRAAILGYFEDQRTHHLLSDEIFPSIKDLFWSMGYHYVFRRDSDALHLVDIFKEVCPEKDWDSVANLGERDAKRKKANY